MKNSITPFVKNAKLFEVLMIFIGITLSMQFDNWNEQRKERKKEKEILSSVYIDLKLNEKDLSSVINSHYRYFIKPLEIMDSALHCEVPIKREDYKQLYLPLGGTFLDNNLGAYHNFKNSGSLLVRNNSLKISLFDYYEINVQWILYQQKNQMEVANLQIIPLFINYAEGNGRIRYEKYLEMRKDKEAINKIIAWKNMYHYSREAHKEIIPKLEKLIVDMEMELVKLGLNPKEIRKGIDS